MYMQYKISRRYFTLDEAAVGPPWISYGDVIAYERPPINYHGDGILCNINARLIADLPRQLLQLGVSDVDKELLIKAAEQLLKEFKSPPPLPSAASAEEPR